MSRQPNNEASEKMARFAKKWFIAIEPTINTSPVDIDDFISLLNELCPRYNLQFAQSFWKDETMNKCKKQ